jgi:hypothetical protein
MRSCHWLFASKLGVEKIGIAEYKYDLAPLPPKFGGNYSLKSPSFGGFRGQTKTLSIAIHTLIQQRQKIFSQHKSRTHNPPVHPSPIPRCTPAQTRKP